MKSLLGTFMRAILGASSIRFPQARVPVEDLKWLRPAPVTHGKARSKYMPHQSIRERARRLRNMTNANG
jgi:hypothetical protein